MNTIVADKIARGLYTLAPRRKGRSLIWTVVSEILKEDGTKVEKLVYCRSCRRILKLNLNQTSNLSRHKCVKELKSKDVKPVCVQAKTNALNAVSNWIVEDCLPFSIISGSGFKAMVECFIKIGALYGEWVDVEDLLPDESTISSKCRDEANGKRQETSYMLQDAVNRGGFSLTVELVPDNYSKRILLGVSVHFDQDFQMINMLLGLKSVDSQRANSEIIRKKIETLLSTFGIHSMENIKFVTNRETTIVKALESNVRLNCSTHLFAEVLDKSFQETLQLVDMLTECKQIIKYLKNENPQNMQNIFFKNSFTLWKSNYAICKLFCDNWSDIHSILTNLNEVHRLNHININTLHEIVELCDNFEIIFKELQKETSLCLVLPSIYKVKSLCEPKDTKETKSILVFKQIINKYISDIWENNISMWHRAAFFLYPPALNMNIDYLNEIQNFCVTETEKISATVNTIQTDELIIKSENVSDSEDSTSTKSATPSNNESIHKNKFFFSNLVQNSMNGKKTPFDEIEKYSREKVLLTDDFEVMDWWKCNKLIYPHLSRFARQVHSIPASSTAVIGSLAGNIIKEKQNKLNPNSIDSLLFLNSFYKSQNE